jgi:peptidoglycan-associated lipoprotein
MNRITRVLSTNIGAWLVVLTLLVFGAACEKKHTSAPPPAPVTSTPSAPVVAQDRPSITFTAEPSAIQRGQSATIRWQVMNATDFTIDNGVGPVGSTGQKVVYPTGTTTYTLTAKGPGGTETKAVTVNVTAPPPPPEDTSKTNERAVDVINRDVKDIYFDYDKNDLRDDARAILTRDAEILKRVFASDSTVVVTVEGNCDERGSAQYNLALGDRRASAAKDFLVQLGVSGDRLRIVSNGNEKPVCTDASEDCYQRNRHDHFAPTAQ